MGPIFILNSIGEGTQHNTDQLIQLSCCRRPVAVPAVLQECNTNGKGMKKMLSEHLDKPLARYILQGILEGFRTMKSRSESQLHLSSYLQRLINR